MTGLLSESDSYALYKEAYNQMQSVPVSVERLRPKIFIDGNQWCCLYGENLQDGIAGFGKTPFNAMCQFELALFKELP